MKSYDVIIIGGGIGGIMTAYELIQKGITNVLMLEKGLPLSDRKCPMLSDKTAQCRMCKVCSIMNGMAGAGAFSDGKYVIGTEYGGWLTDFMSQQVVLALIERADKILMKFGATAERFEPSDELKLECLKHDLYMQQAILKHLGTDDNYETMRKLVEYLNSRIEIRTLTTATDVDKKTNVVTFTHSGSCESAVGNCIVFSVGRTGSRDFATWCAKNGVRMENNQVDVGVRVELPRIIWKRFTDRIYEPKIIARSKGYGDRTRMFCFNDGGEVVTENTDGVLTVNGHSYRDSAKKTQNSNFALLTTTKFTEPFKEPIEYARFIASLANKISGSGVLIQRFGDLVQGRRSNAHRIAQSTVKPSLNAVPGDLSLCMPKRHLDNIIETLYSLDKIAPGTANADTLLYGVECKYYSARPVCENFVIENTNNIFAIGDGAGFTRSLSHAAANGIYVADSIADL